MGRNGYEFLLSINYGFSFGNDNIEVCMHAYCTEY